MRAHEINLDEAPMNPGEFNKAIDTGHEKGVLVGFEFECVVPEATIKGATAAPTGKTKEQVAGLISNDSRITDQDLDDFPLKEFDDLFKILPGHSKYPDMVSMLAGYRTDSMEKIKELFAQIPEKIRAKAVPKAKERVSSRYRSGDGGDPQIDFAYQFGWILTSYFSTKRSGGGRDIVEKGYAIRNLAQDPDYSDLFQYGFQDEGYYIENHLTRFFDFDPQKVYDALNLAEYDDDNDDNRYHDDDDYKGAVKILQPALEQSMGRKVTVFKRYHEHKKNMTDWYIEPDGSLEGDNDGDGTAEVVSPPLPAKDAVQALKNFFALAAQHKIYTNESTGLHINVSIPQKIDLLKLAVFTGDQYVLKNFNRLDSDYAQSVTRDIARGVKDSDGEGDVTKVKLGPKRDKDVFGQQKRTTTINTKVLQRIANDVSDDHMASISSNGKWISFRHTGGNYLKDYNEIYNVVGRFVRAVIIASDPTLYDREYKVAVAKLATPADNPDGTLASRLNYISSNGVPVLEISMASAGRAATVDPKKIFKQVCNDSYALPSYVNMAPSQITLTPNSTTARQKMKSKASSTGRFAAWEQTAMSDRFVTAIYCPLSQVEINRINDRSESGGIQVDGTTYYQITKSLIPGSDPRAKQIMLNMRKEHYRDKLGRQAPPAANSRSGVRRAGFRFR